MCAVCLLWSFAPGYCKHAFQILASLLGGSDKFSHYSKLTERLSTHCYSTDYLSYTALMHYVKEHVTYLVQLLPILKQNLPRVYVIEILSWRENDTVIVGLFNIKQNCWDIL